MQTWPAPAKLNLFLHVLGRRADGFHRLQTVFQFLDYGDELAFRVTEDGRIVRANVIADLPPEQDLCVRAARLLQSCAGVRAGVEITLVKRLPVGGGLGGGSSDAATTLLALNELWGLRWGRETLARLGLALGADVPVFVHGRAAWAEGVGEVLTPIELPEPWYVVFAPLAHVSTAAVFADPDLTRSHPPITIRDFREGRVRNDLEVVVRRRYPAVDEAMNWAAERFGAVRMTGSGACFFLEVPDPVAGRRVLEQAPPPLSGFVARGMNRHPLYFSGE